MIRHIRQRKLEMNLDIVVCYISFYIAQYTIKSILNPKKEKKLTIRKIIRENLEPVKIISSSSFAIP